VPSHRVIHSSVGAVIYCSHVLTGHVVTHSSVSAVVYGRCRLDGGRRRLTKRGGRRQLILHPVVFGAHGNRPHIHGVLKPLKPPSL
jgi:hypothetical protein